MQTFSAGQLVGRTPGEYQIERLLAQGRLGAAYMAQQHSQGRTVIMTVFNFPEDMSAQERERFTTHVAQERAMLVRLTHPTILPMYDCGEYAGALYLVTAFAKGASLAQVLKHQGRFSPHQTLGVLKQVAAGLDYAHSQGAVHGLLSLSNVLISDELTVQLAGFGLRTLLEIYGTRPHMRPQAYLFSTSGTCLGNPQYVSPECVLGMPPDARSDLYALGVMLFELLSGTPLFRGATPLDNIVKRVQQPVPSVHAACPDVPEALDLVLGKTLERDPAKRYQHAGESAAAFERAIQVLEWVERCSTPPCMPSVLPLETGPLPVVASSPSSQKTAQDAVGSGPMKLPGAATSHDSPTELVRAQEVFPSLVGGNPGSLARVDPFARWSATKVTDPFPLESAVTAKLVIAGGRQKQNGIDQNDALGTQPH